MAAAVGAAGAACLPSTKARTLYTTTNYEYVLYDFSQVRQATMAEPPRVGLADWYALEVCDEELQDDGQWIFVSEKVYYRYMFWRLWPEKYTGDTLFHAATRPLKDLVDASAV